ncbi:ferrous iron transport protein A [Iodobacter sp. HSC-16F04]|uniref:Ferrous iron transport protein A n=1 Tax=Iodobacter violaceini TaxID=3044271 RepID=A0ABX0KU82_9NEIS|nr:FeoA family protein [Iodobacter violacea]NHQ88253.1 ferrous iron transport protein A [Iodobacter violacea]
MKLTKTVLIAKTMTLADLPLNTLARILSTQLPPDLTQRLAALGLHVERDIEVIRRGFLGGPLQLRVASTDFMLRREDARQILVDILPQADSNLIAVAV